MFKSPGDYGAFLAYEFGYDKFFGEIIGRYFIMPFFLRWYDPEFASKDLCALMYFEEHKQL